MYYKIVAIDTEANEEREVTRGHQQKTGERLELRAAEPGEENSFNWGYAGLEGHKVEINGREVSVEF